MGSIRGEGGAGGGGGGLADLVDDTTPQLGGNLDVNGFNVGGVTPNELGYLAGTTSDIQTQFDAKQPLNANLTELAGQTGAADKVSYWTAAATLALATLTSFGRSVIACVDAAAARTVLGLGGTDSPTFSAVYAYYNLFGRYIKLTATTGLFWSTNDDPQSGVYVAGLVMESPGVILSTDNGVNGAATHKAYKFVSTVATGSAPLVVASTTKVTNLNADKLDGKDAVDFAPCTQATLTAAASVALDFAAAGLATLTTDQNTTFTTSNRASGRQPYNLRIIGGGAHTLTFPAGWHWLNSTMPAAIASGKTGRLCLECYGSADTDVVASFAVEA